MPFSYPDIIDHLKLEPLEHEGGYFRRTYEIPASEGSSRLGTAIYFLLTEETFSAFHRLKQDELYHFYMGDPVELFELKPNGQSERKILGQKIFENQCVQHLVTAHNWQGSKLITGGSWALLGTTMVPGFEWADFELGNREELKSLYPNCKSQIQNLTHS